MLRWIQSDQKSWRNTDKSAHLAPDPCYITTCPTIFLKKIGGHFKNPSNVRLCAPSWSTTALETDGTFRVPFLIALFIAVITCVRSVAVSTRRIQAQSSYLGDRSRRIVAPDINTRMAVQRKRKTDEVIRNPPCNRIP